MTPEELELYHKHYEVEPFFHTRAEKATWKQHRREEKLIKEQRRHILKHEREMQELEEAYRTLSHPLYDIESESGSDYDSGEDEFEEFE